MLFLAVSLLIYSTHCAAVFLFGISLPCFILCMMCWCFLFCAFETHLFGWLEKRWRHSNTVNNVHLFWSAILYTMLVFPYEYHLFLALALLFISLVLVLFRLSSNSEYRFEENSLFPFNGIVNQMYNGIYTTVKTSWIVCIFICKFKWIKYNSIYGWRFELLTKTQLCSCYIWLWLGFLFFANMQMIVSSHNGN